MMDLRTQLNGMKKMLDSGKIDWKSLLDVEGQVPNSNIEFKNDCVVQDDIKIFPFCNYSNGLLNNAIKYKDKIQNIVEVLLEDKDDYNLFIYYEPVERITEHEDIKYIYDKFKELNLDNKLLFVMNMFDNSMVKVCKEKYNIDIKIIPRFQAFDLLIEENEFNMTKEISPYSINTLYTTLFGRWTTDREFSYKSLEKKNLIDSGFVSRFANEKSHVASHNWEESHLDLYRYLAIHTDSNSVWRTFDKKFRGLQPFYELSFCGVVVEQLNRNGLVCLHDKTCLPILFKRPFLLMAEKHSLKSLKKLGFKSFEEIFDESYDEVSDFEKRIETVVSQIVELNKMSKFDWLELYKKVEDKIEHNHQLLYAYRFENGIDCKFNRYFREQL